MRLRWFLLLSSVLLAAIGTTVVVADRLDDQSGGGDQVIQLPGGESGTSTTDAPGTTTPGDTATDVVAPAAGEVAVSGTVTAVHLEGAVLDPRTVLTPLTLVSERGFGNGGEITGVTIAGKDSAIVWDGGRPFVLSSGPGLVLGAVTADLATDGVRLTLGDDGHSLAPGTYRLNTPVAVGSAGIATSRDAVSFEAGPEATFEASGDTALVLGPTGPHRLLGPGRVHLEGRLTVTDSTGARRSATAFDLDEGAFDLLLTPAAGGGWTVSATTDAP